MSASEHVQDLYRCVLVALRHGGNWPHVAGLQEQIARILPAMTAEGALARRGAVAAAALGGAHQKARELCNRYFDETPCVGKASRQFTRLLDVIDRAAHGEDETVTLQYTATLCIGEYERWLE